MDFHTFKHTNKEFYSAEDIKKAHNEFFVGCRSLRKSIDKHNIPPREYLYMKDKKIYDETYRLAALYISKKYYEEKIVDYKKPDKKKERLEKRQIKDEDIEDEPEEIYLEDYEKFKDDDGKIMEIKMIGKKNIDDIYLKVYDIGKGFDLQRINDTIIEKTSDYEYDIHYKYFKDSNTTRKIMYLTYQGFVKLIFSNRSNYSIHLQSMIIKNLFTLKFGDDNSKQELIANMLHVNLQKVKDFFSKCCNKISCIYLFNLGTYDNLIDVFPNIKNHENKSSVYKFGFTNDIVRRCKEHELHYKKCDLQLNKYIMIKNEYLRESERDVKNFFVSNNYILNQNGYRELVVIPNNKINTVVEFYKNLYDKYGEKNVLNDNIKIKDLTNELDMKKSELENKENLIKLKEIEYYRSLDKIRDLENEIKIMKIEHEKKLLEKDNELLRIKLELCENKLNIK